MTLNVKNIFASKCSKCGADGSKKFEFEGSPFPEGKSLTLDEVANMHKRVQDALNYMDKIFVGKTTKMIVCNACKPA